MKTINHEYFVSLEVAKLLKEADFDWDVEYVYNFGKLIRSVAHPVLGNELAAPTLDVAQRWLREVKRMDVIISVFGGSPDKIYVYEVNTWATWKNGVVADKEYIGDSYTTYEEAKEAGIKKALEIILEKGK